LWFELVISKILSSRSFHHHAFDLLLSNLKIRVKLPLSQKCLSALSIIKESLVTILASQISTQNILLNYVKDTCIINLLVLLSFNSSFDLISIHTCLQTQLLPVSATSISFTILACYQ
jgi:hypothetical protein